MLDQILGWFSLVVGLLIILATIKDKRVFHFVIFAFLLRSFFVILDQYFINLPDSTFDAKSFEASAAEISEEYGLSILSNMFQDNNLLISRIISIFYTLTFRSEMMSQIISVGLGTASVYLIYRLALIVWDRDSAIKAAWIAAIYPSMVLYSTLVLREVYIVFVLLLVLIACLLFIKNNFDHKTNNKNNTFLENIKLILLIFFGFYLLKNMHGAIFIGFFIFIFFATYCFLKKQFIKLRKGKLTLKLFIGFFLVTLPFLIWYFEIFKIPYIPGPERILYLQDILIRRFNVGTISTMHGIYGSTFPLWTIPENNLDFFPKIFARIIYFLYSPFPWDIKRYSHMIGLAEATFMIYLTIAFWNNRKLIWNNNQTRFLLLILATFIILYGLGTSNFGTSIRHKSKFIFILICLAAPKLVKFSISSSK